MGFLNRSKLTLQRERSVRKNHPPFIKLGQLIYYPVDQFHQWFASQPVHFDESQQKSVEA